MDASMLLLVTALLLQLVGAQDTCQQIDKCTCRFTDGSKISLTTLSNSDGKPRFDFTDATPPSAYLYAYNPCQGFTYEAPCTNVAACQKSKVGTNIYDIGNVDTAQFNPQGSSITYTATVDSTTRTTVVHLVCAQDKGVPEFSAKDQPVGDNYEFTLTTCLACRTGCPRSGLSGGSFLCILFSVTLVLYFVIGVLFLKFVRGAEGKELIPNFEFWKDLPLLIKDGVLFVGRGCKAEPDNYEQI